MKKYPTKSLLELSQLIKLRFLFIGSPLLTNVDIRDLKSEVKKLVQSSKPYLVARFQNKLHYGDQVPFYGIEDVTGLPMEFQKNVASLKILSNSNLSLSDVANVNINQYF